MVVEVGKGVAVARLGKGDAGEKFVERITEDGVYRDGAGLYLQVTNGGKGKSWLFRYTFGGEGKTMSLGTYRKGVTLDTARKRAKEADDWLWEGKDPKKAWADKKQKEEIEAGQPYLVWHFIDQYTETVVKNFDDPKSQAAAERHCNDIRDTIGDMPAREVTPRIVVHKTGLYDKWDSQRPTARALRNHLVGVFSFADADGVLDRNPTDPKRLKVLLPRKKYHAKPADSIPFGDVPRFLARLREERDKDGQYPTRALMLEVIIVTGVRSQEMREAQWKEIDWENEVWKVPPGHLKLGKKYNKMRPLPITKPMLAVLEKMKERRVNPSDDEALIFPPPRSPDGRGNPFSEGALSQLIIKLDWEKPVRPHGFRSTLKVCAEAKGWDDILVERQQDHQPKSGTATAARYGHLVREEAEDVSLHRRREMMKLYADICDPPSTDDNVV